MLKLICLVVATSFVSTFNLETADVWEYSKSTGGYFGYSVHLTNANSRPRLVVSVPKYNIDKQGRVYECDPDDTNQCDTLRIKHNDNEDYASRRNGQWLGMDLSGGSRTILVCAPLWHKNVTEVKRGQPDIHTIENLGRCHLFDMETMKTLFTRAPCEHDPKGNLKYGFCEAGISTTVAMVDGKELFYYVGTPGRENYSGGIKGLRERSDEGEKSPKNERNSSYTGYSVSWGEYGLTANKKGSVAAGAPRANDLYGEVMVYDINADSSIAFPSILENPDKQVGAYFGAEVCAVDLNDDGKDDLLVGAPYYSISGDEGRVYVYMSENDGLVEQENKRLSPETRVSAWFGLHIADVGDLNGDGYNDVAISAPRGGRDGKGAVYIYNGGKDGIHPRHSQIIDGADFLKTSGAYSFGISVSGKVDMDGNKLPDIAIGAYDEEKAFVLRSRSIVKVSSDFRVVGYTDGIPLNIKQSNCKGPDKKQYYCVEVRPNLRFEDNAESFEVEVTFTAKNGRAFFLDGNTLTKSVTSNVTLFKGVIKPVKAKLYIQMEGKFDIMEAIKIEANYTTHEANNCGGRLCPVVDHFGTTYSVKELEYKKECGGDNKCDINLVAESKIVLPGVSQQGVIVYGSVYGIVQESRVENRGETAYQPNLKFTFTNEIQVESISIDGDKQELEKTSNTEITIALEKSIKKDESVEIVVKYSMPRAKPNASEYVFTFEASAIGDEVNPKDDKVVITMPTKIESCVRVESQVEPSLVFLNKEAKQPLSGALVSQLGHEVNYTFNIRNTGHFSVTNLEAEINFVTKKDDVDLLYIVKILDTAGVIKCTSKVPENYKNFKVVYSSPGKKRVRREATDILKCGEGGECNTFRCDITKLEKGGAINLVAVTRVWDANFVELDVSEADVTGDIKVKFVGDDQNEIIQKEQCNLDASAHTRVRSHKVTKQKKIEWWIILVAVLAAVLLLIIAIIVLWKCGFFKRKRNEQKVHEQEPLNDEEDVEDEEK